MPCVGADGLGCVHPDRLPLCGWVCKGSHEAAARVASIEHGHERPQQAPSLVTELDGETVALVSEDDTVTELWMPHANLCT